MKFYQEITLIEQMDVDFNHILASTMQSLHEAISLEKGAAEAGSIALSFPEYDYVPNKKGFLGKKIRCFAETEAELASIDLNTVLESLADYARVSEIKEVGDKATHYEIYSKYRHKSSVKKAERLYAHLLKKFGQEKFDREVGGFDAVLENCHKGNKQLPYPYVNLTSSRTGNRYPLRIQRKVVGSATKNNAFSGFGLSDQSKLSAVPAW